MHAENTVNVVLVPDADLNVCFAPETRVGVDALAFCEDATNCIERLLAVILSRLMQEPDDSAIELAESKVKTSNILGHPGACDVTDGLEVRVCLFYSVNSVGRDEVEAKSRIDHRANNKGFDLPVLICQDSTRSLPRPFESAVGIGFPEIYTWSQPIVVVLTCLKGFIPEQAFTGLAIAAVVAENERCGKAMHPAGTAR